MKYRKCRLDTYHHLYIKLVVIPGLYFIRSPSYNTVLGFSFPITSFEIQLLTLSIYEEWEISSITSVYDGKTRKGLGLQSSESSLCDSCLSVWIITSSSSKPNYEGVSASSCCAIWECSSVWIIRELSKRCFERDNF